MPVHALPRAVLRDVLGDVVRNTLGDKNGLAIAIGAQRDRKQLRARCKRNKPGLRGSSTTASQCFFTRGFPKCLPQ